MRVRLTSLLAVALVSAAVTAIAMTVPVTAQGAPGWVKIEGADRLPAAKKLRYRVRCLRACRVQVTARVIWPARPNLVNRIRGGLRSGESRRNIVVLNRVALNVLRANYRQSRLRVVVRATDKKTGATATARRTFRFTYSR